VGSCGGPNSIVVGRRIYGGSSIAAVSSARHICNQSVAAIVWCPRAERLRIKVPDPGVRLTARIPLPRERHGARRQAAADSGYIGRLFMSDVSRLFAARKLHAHATQAAADSGCIGRLFMSDVSRLFAARKLHAHATLVRLLKQVRRGVTDFKVFPLQNYRLFTGK
jgi:hypothetical protein